MVGVSICLSNTGVESGLFKGVTRVPVILVPNMIKTRSVCVVVSIFLFRRYDGRSLLRSSIIFPLAHLVSGFACNSRVIVDASSNPTGVPSQIAVTKKC